MGTSSAQYYWNDTAVSYACDSRVPTNEQWAKFEVPDLGYPSKAASGPYCNASVTYMGAYVSINGAIGKNGSTWGCSADGETWFWHEDAGNHTSWTAQVLCAFDGMEADVDHPVFISTSPSGGSEVVVTSWIGLSSSEYGTSSGLHFDPAQAEPLFVSSYTQTTEIIPESTISQPAPTDLDSSSSSVVSSASSSSGSNSTSAASNSTSSGASASGSSTGSASAAQAASSIVSTSPIVSAPSSSSSSSGSSSTSSSTNVTLYAVVGALLFGIVGACFIAASCLKTSSSSDDDDDDKEKKRLLLEKRKEEENVGSEMLFLRPLEQRQ
ncbi:hypothetical protein JCM5296_002725 [Sporobolomyces johnsonii]